MKTTVFLGAPGSGKGTQAKRLSATYGLKHFSTGDMLRAAMQSGSEIGTRAKSYIEKGELVPDGIMIELIEDALDKLGPTSKVILDGFPRTVPQAESLDQKELTTVDKAIYFKIERPLLIKRLTGRRICEKCGEPFHIFFLPPKQADVCDKCNGKLIQRTDDGEDVVQRRLEIFEQQNDKLLSYYAHKKKLYEVNADAAVETVQTLLSRILD